MRQAEEENLQLKKLVADLSPDKVILQDVLAGKKDLTLARLREWRQRTAGLFCSADQPQFVPR
jgi:hypothetical protein